MIVVVGFCFFLGKAEPGDRGGVGDGLEGVGGLGAADVAVAVEGGGVKAFFNEVFVGDAGFHDALSLSTALLAVIEAIGFFKTYVTA